MIAKVKKPKYRLVVNSLGEQFRKVGRRKAVEVRAHQETPAEKIFCDRVGVLQGRNDSRFRIWGEMLDEDGTDCKAWLVTEFINWSDDKEFWKYLDEVAEACDCEIALLDERKHLDQHWPAELAKSGVKLTQANVVHGVNDGRMEKQVELRRNVYGLDPTQIAEQINTMRKVTAPIWHEYGVSVI